MKKNSNKLFLLILVIIVVIAVIIGCTTKESASQTTSVDSVITDSEPELISIGEYKLTAYCGCSKCCGQWGENRPLDEDGNPIVYTANMTIAEEGVTIAADTDILPYGTEVIIDGHKYIVQDKGSSISGNEIDIYFESHQAAVEFGVRYKEVFVERGVEQ